MERSRLRFSRLALFSFFWIVGGFWCPQVKDHRVPRRDIAEEINQSIPCIRDAQVKRAEEPLWDYFYPAWRDGGRSLFRVGELDLRELLSDPLQRMDISALAPREVHGRILFWSTIYSKFTSRMRVIHDRERPEIIYGYLDFSSFYENNTEMVATLRAHRAERQIVTNLRGLLTEIANASALTTIPLSEKMQVLGHLRKANGTGELPDIRALSGRLRVQTGQSDQFRAALERAQSFLPYFEEVFGQRGLPKSLARIPFVESSFNQHARSKRGALGMWQFVPQTAKEMIHADNRKLWHDPVHQANGAARLLRRYRHVLPDWGSAITAYNAGVGRVSRILEANAGNSITDLLAVPESSGGLGFASKNFYAEVLAANLVEAYKTELIYPELFPDSVVKLRHLANSPVVVACWANLPKESPTQQANVNLLSAGLGDLDGWLWWFKQIF